MCFTNDYDWIAGVCERGHVVAPSLWKCCECGAEIASGTRACCVDMLEYEECQECGVYHEGIGANDECQHDFGEEFSCHWCEDCDKMFQAIQTVEKEAGCSPGESLPPHEMMIEELRELRFYNFGEALKYFKRALRDFPELKRSGYIQRIATKVFC